MKIWHMGQELGEIGEETPVTAEVIAGWVEARGVLGRPLTREEMGTVARDPFPTKRCRFLRGERDGAGWDPCPEPAAAGEVYCAEHLQACYSHGALARLRAQRGKDRKPFTFPQRTRKEETKSD